MRLLPEDQAQGRDGAGSLAVRRNAWQRNPDRTEDDWARLLGLCTQTRQAGAQEGERGGMTLVRSLPINIETRFRTPSIQSAVISMDHLYRDQY